MKPYLKYKDSKEEWIKQMFGNEKIIKLKYSLSGMESGNRESGGGNQYGDGVFSIGGEHIGWYGEIFEKDKKFISEEYFNKMKKGKIKLKDVLLVKDGATIGKCAYVDKIPEGRAAVNEHVFILRANNKNSAKYIYYFIWSYIGQEQIKLQIRGSAQPGLNSLFQNYLFIPDLSINIQEKIVFYLDNKTKQIDDLISKKERMIELLKEYRAAVINEAVTKGLNLNVKMKDSGVEWIGEIPEHWEVKKIKYCIKGKLEYGANEVAELEDINLPRYIRITDFDEEGNLKNETFKSLTIEQAKNFYLKEGDILFTRSGATVGKTFQFKNYKGKACYAGYLIKSTPNLELILSDFLFYFTKSNLYENWKNSIFIQTTIQNIGADKYQNLLIPIPPIEEQRIIIKFLSKKLKYVNDIIKNEQKSIDLLKEYRISLISEVVTGKANVI